MAAVASNVWKHRPMMLVFVSGFWAWRLVLMRPPPRIGIRQSAAPAAYAVSLRCSRREPERRAATTCLGQGIADLAGSGRHTRAGASRTGSGHVNVVAANRRQVRE